MPPTPDRPTHVLDLWTVLIGLLGVVVVAVTHGVAVGKPIRSLEDGKTGTVEFESLTCPLSGGWPLRRSRGARGARGRRARVLPGAAALTVSRSGPARP